MHVGVAMFCTDYAMAATELATALEQRGFESLWLPEHSHIPLTRLTPYPAGGELPKKYYDVMDPFVVLGAAAAVTSAPEDGDWNLPGAAARPDPDGEIGRHHRPIVARQVPVRCGRRLERRRDGRPRHRLQEPQRGDAREASRPCARSGPRPSPSISGEFVNFGPMMTWPKPVQKPHPPVLVGGGMPYGARRALAFGDGWMPHARRPTYRLLEKLPRVSRNGEGRRPHAPHHRLRRGADPAEWPAYRDAGIERIVLSIELGSQPSHLAPARSLGGQDRRRAVTRSARHVR